MSPANRATVSALYTGLIPEAFRTMKNLTRRITRTEIGWGKKEIARLGNRRLSIPWRVPREVDLGTEVVGQEPEVGAEFVFVATFQGPATIVG